MKNLIYALIFVLLASSVCAASFTAGDMTFTSPSGNRGVTVTQPLNLFNTGTDTLVLSISSNIPSTYNVVLGQTSVSLPAGEGFDVPVTMFIPLSQDSGIKQVPGGILVVATSVANSSDTAQDIVQVYTDTENMLKISKVQLEVDGDTNTLKDGSTYDDDLKAGASIKIIVKVSNEFSSSEDYEIQDIEVEIEGSGDLDLDDSEDMSDLDQGDDDTVTFSAEIPSDADDGDDYDIDITVTGEDENGVMHEDTFSATIEVSRESHELTVKGITFNPKNIICSGKVTMNIDLENTGKYDEDNVNLLVVSDGLNIEQSFYISEFGRDDTVRKQFSFNINDDVNPGQYDFMVTSYYDVDEVSDVETATLTVEECKTTSSTGTTTGTTNTQTGTSGITVNTNTTTQPVIPQVIPINGATPVYGTSSFTDSPVYLAILIAGVLLLLIILIILLVKFVF